MAFKAFPYKWTCLVGIALLSVLVWSGTFSDGYSDLLVLLFALCFFVSVIASIALLVKSKSRSVFYRILINLMILVLLFPALRLGGFLQNRLFLMHLSEFQQITDKLIREEQAKPHPDSFIAIATLPPGTPNLRVRSNVRIDATKGSITVRYLVRNSSALSHRGYMYRSDDNPADLEKEFPHTGYTHIAPHWFYFSE
ncbi:MAG: hypothetical protein ACHQIK_00165 [Candidatus Acidiferrales bacterium]